MNLEEQVCSLDLSKRLKELGVKQESEFVWYVKKDGEDGVIWRPYTEVCEVWGSEDEVELYSAFTVAELGEVLSMRSISFQNYTLPACLNPPCRVSFHKINEFGQTKQQLCYVEEYTEADARAKMLIWLIENKYMEVEI